MAPQAASEAQPKALHFDPNGPGMGLDVDFSNFDSDIANFGFNNSIDFEFGSFDLGTGLDSGSDGMNCSAGFAFGGVVGEAESSHWQPEGPRETFQEANTDMNSLSPGHLPFLKLVNDNSDALTQEPVHSSFNGMRAQKRKKMDEVDKSSILPEGSRRNRNKTTRARGLD